MHCWLCTVSPLSLYFAEPLRSPNLIPSSRFQIVPRIVLTKILFVNEKIVFIYQSLSSTRLTIVKNVLQGIDGYHAISSAPPRHHHLQRVIEPTGPPQGTDHRSEYRSHRPRRQALARFQRSQNQTISPQDDERSETLTSRTNQPRVQLRRG